MIQSSKSKPVVHDTSIISRATASCWVKSSQDITTNNYLPLQSSKAEVETTKSLWWRESKGEQMWEQIPQMTPYCKSKVEDAVQMMLHILNWMQYLIRVPLFNGRFLWFQLKFCGPDHSPWSPLRINIEVGCDDVQPKKQITCKNSKNQILPSGKLTVRTWNTGKGRYDRFLLGPKPQPATAAMPACCSFWGVFF